MAGMTTLDHFIAGLPKAELHVHHVGSASPGIVSELAARHEGDTKVPADPELLADLARASVWQSFLDEPGKTALIAEIDNYETAQGLPETRD